MPPKIKGPKTPEEFFGLFAERLSASAMRPNMYGYKPHAKQAKFHSAQEKCRLYIGGNRAGKTTAGVIEDLKWLTHRHETRAIPEGPIRGRIVCVDFNQGVEKIVLPELARWIPPSDLTNGSWEDSYSKELRTLTLANGSFVELMSYDQDTDKFAGTSRHFIHYDEEPPADIYEECQARLIDTGGSCWLTMTPLLGMTWVYDDIYLPGKTGSKPSISVVEVAMWENPHLGEAEVQQYLAGLTPDQRKARGEGKFVQMGGLIYKDFSAETHTIPIDEFLTVLDPTYEIYESMDHGYNNATAWLWHAVAKNGRTVTFREHVESEWTVDRHAAKVLEIRQEIIQQGGSQVIASIGDPAIGQRNAVSGTSIQEEYASHGVYISLGNNRVADGLERVNKYLRTNPLDNQPNLLITRNCPVLINQMIRLRWKTFNSKKIGNDQNKFEIQHKKDDHAPDALRYYIMSRPDLFLGGTPNVYIPPVDIPGYSTPSYSGDPTRDIDYVLAAMVAASNGSGNGFGSDYESPVGNSFGGSEYSYSPTGTGWELDENLGGSW